MWPQKRNVSKWEDMHICLFNLSKYYVSLFHLYIAFYATLITASSSYNINNDYGMSETFSLFGCWFCKIKLLCEIKLILWKSIRNQNVFQRFNYFLFWILLNCKFWFCFKYLHRSCFGNTENIYQWKVDFVCYADFSIFPQDWFREINRGE